MHTSTHIHTRARTHTHIWDTVKELISFGEVQGCRFHVSSILTPILKEGCFQRQWGCRRRIGSFSFCLDVSEENPSPLSRQLHEIQPLQGPPLPIFPTRWIIGLMIVQTNLHPKLLESKWHLLHPPQDELMRNPQLVPLSSFRALTTG